MSQLHDNQPNQDGDNIDQLTSLQWQWADRAFEKLEAVPQRTIAALGAQRAVMIGIVGLIAMAIMTSALVVAPLSKLPFGAPPIFTPETAQSFLPNSKLAKLRTLREAGALKYVTTYITSYFVPQLFSTKLKKPDLLMLLFRCLFFGVLILLCVRLTFATKEDDHPPAS